MKTLIPSCVRSSLVAALASVTLVTGPMAPSSHASGLTFTSIDVPGAARTDALGINDGGVIVGDCLIGDRFHGFVLSGGTLSTFDVPGAAHTLGIAINDRNQIAGYWLDDVGNLHGFSLEAGIFTRVDFPGATSTFVIDIDQRGRLAGGFIDSAGATHGFTFEAGRFARVDLPGATYTEIDGLSDRMVAKPENGSLASPVGKAVGDYVDSQGTCHGFLLERGVVTTIDVPGAKFTEAIGIDRRGRIVGSYDDLHGYLLDGGVFTRIDVPGSLLTKAAKLNDHGEIVGFYGDSAGRIHGFLAR